MQKKQDKNMNMQKKPYKEDCNCPALPMYTDQLQAVSLHFSHKLLLYKRLYKRTLTPYRIETYVLLPEQTHGCKKAWAAIIPYYIRT